MEQLLIDINEARRITSLSRTTVYKLIAENRLATVKIGRRRLIKVQSVQELLSSSDGR
jgi:excisionase family DNA binding protein